MGYVDKFDWLAKSYGISRRTWKWTKKLLFHLVDITILNAYILSKSVGKKLNHKIFRESLVRNLILEAHELNTASRGITPGRPSQVEA